MPFMEIFSGSAEMSSKLLRIIENFKILNKFSKHLNNFVKYFQFCKFFLEKWNFGRENIDIFEIWIHFII